MRYDLDEQYNRHCVLPSLQNYKNIQYDLDEQYNRHCVLPSFQNYKIVQYDFHEQYDRHRAVQDDLDEQYNRHCVLPSLQNGRTAWAPMVPPTRCINNISTMKIIIIIAGHEVSHCLLPACLPSGITGNPLHTLLPPPPSPSSPPPGGRRVQHYSTCSKWGWKSLRSS